MFCHGKYWPVFMHGWVIEMGFSQRMEVRRHDLLADVADRTMQILKRYGLNDSQAQEAADSVVDDLADNWGGQFITVPKDMKYRNAKRRQAIVEAFDGSNHSELATQHGLSVNAVYKILKRAQAK
ncbi:Mor transcription activator family protein [Ectopseudomonas guguanensis]|uniref:Mor transcription activator family protein n=1 Tax=Ectopseudomonas guguanensis TaxID=1198456 RepID=UPI0028AD0ECB|nr:Mor transcription activator family protein [Pseudomonas guguanensis]